MGLSKTKLRGRGLYEVFNPSFGDDRQELWNWLVMDTWSYEAAIWLIAGVIPTQIYEGFGFFKFEGGLLDKDEKNDRIAQISSLTRIWLSNPNNPKQAPPQVYFDWAESKDIDIYWLEGAREWGHFIQPNAHFKSAAGETKNVEVADLEKLNAVEKPLSLKERNTLLTIIALLCKEAQIDYTRPSKAAGLILHIADRMGVRISETVIENHLKKIPDALGTRTK